jgi:hypothetical protein
MCVHVLSVGNRNYFCKCIFNNSKIIFKTWYSGINSGDDTNFIFTWALTPKIEISSQKQAAYFQQYEGREEFQITGLTCVTSQNSKMLPSTCKNKSYMQWLIIQI